MSGKNNEQFLKYSKAKRTDKVNNKRLIPRIAMKCHFLKQRTKMLAKVDKNNIHRLRYELIFIVNDKNY